MNCRRGYNSKEKKPGKIYEQDRGVSTTENRLTYVFGDNTSYAACVGTTTEVYGVSITTYAKDGKSPKIEYSNGKGWSDVDGVPLWRRVWHGSPKKELTIQEKINFAFDRSRATDIDELELDLPEGQIVIAEEVSAFQAQALGSVVSVPMTLGSEIDIEPNPRNT